MTAPFRFRFDAVRHDYIGLGDDAGVVYPHITSMLDSAGLVDDLWLTEESSERGSAVHAMTADYDLGALHPDTVVSVHRGYLLAYVKAISIVRPEILAVEEPLVHPVFKFGGRPDRDVRLFGLRGVLEIKSGIKTKAHQVQTALQAVLLSAKCGVHAEHLGRWCLYLKATGKFTLEDHNLNQFERVTAFAKAREILARVCGQQLEPAPLEGCPF